MAETPVNLEDIGIQTETAADQAATKAIGSEGKVVEVKPKTKIQQVVEAHKAAGPLGKAIIAESIKLSPTIKDLGEKLETEDEAKARIKAELGKAYAAQAATAKAATPESGSKYKRLQPKEGQNLIGANEIEIPVEDKLISVHKAVEQQLDDSAFWMGIQKEPTKSTVEAKRKIANEAVWGVRKDVRITYLRHRLEQGLNLSQEDLNDLDERGISYPLYLRATPKGRVDLPPSITQVGKGLEQQIDEVSEQLVNPTTDNLLDSRFGLSHLSKQVIDKFQVNWMKEYKRPTLAETRQKLNERAGKAEGGPIQSIPDNATITVAKDGEWEIQKSESVGMVHMTLIQNVAEAGGLGMKQAAELAKIGEVYHTLHNGNLLGEEITNLPEYQMVAAADGLHHALLDENKLKEEGKGGRALTLDETLDRKVAEQSIGERKTRYVLNMAKAIDTIDPDIYQTTE